MEIKEAMDILEKDIHTDVPKAAVSARKHDAAVRMALVALEKQIPVKPIILDELNGDIGDADRWDERLGLAKKWLSARNKLLRIGSDPEHFYKILKVELDEAERTTERIGNFTATFLTKDGLRYLESGLGEMKARDVVDNPYEVAYPIYKITGEGECTLSVNGGKMVANVGQNLTIDTGRKLAYREDGTLSNTSVAGDYDDLILIEGRNKIKITDGFELKVIPNWRCL